MGPGFWIAEGVCLANAGWMASRTFLHYRGIQSALWPVTIVVRAIARDPIRDPAPKVANRARIKELEEELGIGQEPPQETRQRAYGTLGVSTPQERPTTPSGRSLASSGNKEETDWMDAFGGFQ